MRLSPNKSYLVLMPLPPIIKFIAQCRYSEALQLCNISTETNDNYMVYYLKATILNYLNYENEGFECFNKGRILQKLDDLSIDPDSVLFHSYFLIYDQSLIDICARRLKANKKKRKKFKERRFKKYFGNPKKTPIIKENKRREIF